MKIKYIKISDIKITEYQRETLPWTVRDIAESVKNHGYNIAYPIIINEDNELVDGGHRIEAAKSEGLDEVPFIRKPDGISHIRYAMQCNDDRGRGRSDDVFDKADYCWKLAVIDEMSGQQIADELGWSDDLVSKHKLIKERLHLSVWNLTRYGSTKKVSIVDWSKNSLVESESTKVEWKETYFRPIISHLALNTQQDNAIMRAQLRVIRETFVRSEDPTKKVTAKSINIEASKQAWHTKSAKYTRDTLANEVGYTDRKGLLKSIYSGVFGNKEDDKNFVKLQDAVSAINEEVLGVKLYQDDAFQFIPLLKDDSVALVTTDPPYNVTDKEWDKIGTDEEYIKWLSNWLELIKPKLKVDYHLFVCISAQYQAEVERLLIDNDWPLKSRIIWSHRNLSKGRDATNKFLSTWEMIFHCGTHSLNWPPEWNEERFEVQEWANPQSNFEDKKYHPTSKPTGLFELFVKVGSKPGDIVLDTFAGGGVTGQACKNLGQRQCILIEKEDEFCQTIENRLGIKRSKWQE